jgi:exportin-2 (importin alpha re-exporter)
MLLNYHKGSGLPAEYSQLLSVFLSPAVWESQGNVPALVKLLDSFLAVGSKDIVAKGQLVAFLGVSQKLISSKLNDSFGFELLMSIFEYVPV